MSEGEADHSTEAVAAGLTYSFGTLTHPGSCMDVRAAGASDGTQIQEYACNGTPAQSFTLQTAGGGAYTLLNTNAKKCVDVQAAGTANGTKVQLWDCNGTPAQSFTVKLQANGSVTFVNTNSGKCLDVQGGNPADSTVVQLFDCNGTNAQLWNPTTVGGAAGGGSSSSSSCDPNAWVYMGNNPQACVGHLGESCGYTATNGGQGYTCQTVSYGTDCEPGPVCPGGNPPNPPPGGGTTPSPAKFVGGYYPNWTPSPARIKDVDPHYNLIYLFAATPIGGSPGNGAIAWTAPGDGRGAATNLNADIAYARRTQGRKIIMSVGGAGQAMSFPNRATSQTFVSSVQALYNQLGGFDGIDWDTYEGSDSPDTSEMIWISLQLKSIYPGFMITSPPAPWRAVDQTFCSNMAAAGALDFCAPQYYDGPGLATQSYIVSNVGTWANLLGENKLVVGFGISTAANYMTVGQVISTWQALEMSHPNLRGAFDWSISTDQSTGWPFGTQVGPIIDP